MRVLSMGSVDVERETDSQIASPSTSVAPARDASAAVSSAACPSPADTLRHDEWLRVRLFVAVVFGLVVIGAVGIPLLGGNPVLRSLVNGALGAAGFSCLAFLVHVRDERRYTIRATLLAALPVTALLAAASLYFGVFSGILMFYIIAIYFFALAQSRVLSLGLYLICAVLQLGITLLTSFGVLSDDGLIRPDNASFAHRAVLGLMIEAGFLAAYVFGRASRRATLSAVAGLELALRQLSQRDALLQEANHDLERALGGGAAGRLSRARVGPWILGEVIGRGAMGEVYRARHAERDQVAAVKLLAAHRQTQPNELRRFLREAEVVSQLRSPHVVEVYDAHDGAEGLPYIAMELLVGHDLSWHLRKQRTLSPSATVELVSHVAAALEHARERTIVHRDLKPQNLFHARVGGDLRLWKVLDFGISSLGGVAGSLTGGRPIGTPGYMAPEQARGGHLDHRADVFALTVIAYRALTGRPAFTGEDFPRVLFNVAYAQPLRPGELVSLPEDVDLVLAIGLAKDAADRFESALALADALLAATRGELTGRLRARAAALLARAPWGQPIR